MVCSCAMSSNCVWLQIIFCSYVKESTLFSFLRSLLRENGWSLRFPRISLKNKLGHRMIRQLLNSVIAKYRDLSVSRRSIICLSRSACYWQITLFYSTSSTNCWLFISGTITTISMYDKGGSNSLFLSAENFFNSNKITSITNETSTERPMFSLRKHPTLSDAIPDFPAKWHQRN